jgi:hypothetical protein
MFDDKLVVILRHYKVNSRFHEDFRTLTKRCERWAPLYWVCRFLIVPVCFMAELGLLLSSVCVPVVPFLVLELCRIRPPDSLYWICATTLLLCLVALLYLTARRVFFDLRNHYVEVEAVVMLGGFFIVTFLVLSQFPIGWSNL